MHSSGKPPSSPTGTGLAFPPQTAKKTCRGPVGPSLWQGIGRNGQVEGHGIGDSALLGWGDLLRREAGNGFPVANGQ